MDQHPALHDIPHCSQITVGGIIPADVNVQEGKPGEQIKFGDLIGKGKVIVTGVPAAFSPTCSETHIPGYIAKADDLKAKGVTEIFCISVNDAFVMKAWGKALGAEVKVRMIADPAADLTKAMNVAFDKAIAVFGNVRSERYALLVEDGKVLQALHEEGPGFEKCSAEEMLKLL